MININKLFSEKYLKAFLAIIFLALCVSLYFNFKPLETDKIDIVIPEKKGEKDNPNPTPLPQKPEKEIKYIVVGKDTVRIPNEVNTELLKKYQEMLVYKDSLAIYKAYIKAIEVNRYHEVVDNEDVRIDIYTKTTGTMDSISTKYKIKEQKITAEIPESKSKLLLGGGLLYDYNNSIENKSINFVGEVSYQSKKNDVYTLGITSNKQLLFTFKTPLIK